MRKLSARKNSPVGRNGRSRVPIANKVIFLAHDYYVHHLNPVLLQLGPVAIHWYGVAYIAGSSAALHCLWRACGKLGACKPRLGIELGIEFVILVADIRVEACTYDQH